MDENTIIERLQSQEGRPGEVARALIDYRKSGWERRGQTVRALTRVLTAGSPETCAAVFENGPRQLVTALHGGEAADWVGKMAGRLNLYVHSPSSYRRSFRTKDLNPYLNRFISLLLECLFFSWEDFDILRDLTQPPEDTKGGRLSGFVYGDLLALRIDEGDAALIGAVKEVCLGDNNTRLLSDAIINGIVKSENQELHTLLGDMLLAAKLQEGLRQSILENADNGRVEAFTRLIALVLDKDLLRYSSAVRALNVWMGLGQTFEDKRVAEKLLRLGYTYLTDAAARNAGAESPDVTEIYAALWAASVWEMNDAVSLINTLVKGEKYRKLTALCFLTQLENQELQSAVAAQFLTETDLDTLSLVMVNYLSSYTGWHDTAGDFSNACQTYRILEDKNARDQQFDRLLRILPLVPAKGYASNGTPFPWWDLSLTRRDIGTRLLIVAGYDFDPDKTARLIDAMPQADPDNRAFFIRFFLETPEAPKSRAFVFASLNDKSMGVRSQALKNLLELSGKPAGAGGIFTEEDEKAIMNLLALKTGEIRQNAVKILLNLPDERPVAAARVLLSDRNKDKRLAGLDILTQLVQQERLSRAEAVDMLAGMPAVTDTERVLITALTAEAARYREANGFGLYDPAYVPDFPPLLPDANHRLESVFGVSPQRIREIFDALRERIKENRDYAYTVHRYDGDQEVLLGGLERVISRAEVHDDQNLTRFEKFVLHDQWRRWIRDLGITFSEIFLFMFMAEVKDYDDRYEPDYETWANDRIGELFQVRELDQFISCYDKEEYGKLALDITGILSPEYSEDERFAVISGALADLIATVPAEDWKRSIDQDGGRMYYRGKKESRLFADTEEVEFLLEELKKAALTDEHFKTYTAFCFTLGRLSGMFYRGMDTADVARAVDLGILKIDALYRTMFLSTENAIRCYAGKVKWDRYKKDVERFPFLKKTADQAAARIIEIELQRGDSATEVSHLALAINRHEGVETFVKILTALGTETFVRGYIYSGGDPAKKTVLSSLLKNCHPKPEDSAETLRAALTGNLTDRRLIEAAMYAPGWIDILGDYLGWPGLKSAAWYFHAHVNETFSAEKETEVARYSSITPQEFNAGAFDIAWFRNAYAALGEERFGLVYDCAKYLTSGANHRRAQLFADAVLGKLETGALWKEAHEKRNRDKLLSYSLIPLKQGGEQEDALTRYENIQLFLKESKSFGAQRRGSEGAACAIALENLGRNAGFSDSLRFTWRMETLKIESVKAYFENRTCGDYQVRVAITEEGAASLVCEKGGKALASVPAVLKKDPSVLECKEIAGDLKAQYQRARENLERAMVNRDVFPFGEITSLMEHPVVAPLLSKLVFVSLKDDGEPAASGAFCEFAGVLNDTSPVRLAHPFDLYTLGTWLDCQRYAFEQKLVQPFKQIFRELYLINEDEREARTVSRRYAGHQVQPKKTVALLKSRLWTVDYEEGLQRVYHRENLYAKLYAAADWFSPADIEAPTLETLEFFDRTTHKAVPLEAVPPLIFSEVMRDIDLVVSVAHVGGVDPEASLSTVEMRAAIVGELLRLLHIANVRVEGRHAKITGRLGEYTVHLGSAQAHKLGRGAVNILAIPSQHRGRVFLPFADDDPRTAEVISKIILLAEDSAIKDPAILAQIG